MKHVWPIIIITVVGAVGYGLWTGYRKPSEPSKPGTYDALAQCLTEKGVVMYGADWCPHCQNQKKLFGPSFQYVTYIECPKEPKVCLEKNITGYPTWLVADGTRLEGEQSLAKLAEVSGCRVEE
jgi:glutaredoxin